MVILRVNIAIGRLYRKPLLYIELSANLMALVLDHTVRFRIEPSLIQPSKTHERAFVSIDLPQHVKPA